MECSLIKYRLRSSPDWTLECTRANQPDNSSRDWSTSTGEFIRKLILTSLENSIHGPRAGKAADLPGRGIWTWSRQSHGRDANQMAPSQKQNLGEQLPVASCAFRLRESSANSPAETTPGDPLSLQRMSSKRLPLPGASCSRALNRQPLSCSAEF